MHIVNSSVNVSNNKTFPHNVALLVFLTCLSRNVGCADCQLGISTLLLLIFCSVVGVVAMVVAVCATGSTFLFFSDRLSITVPFFGTVA